MVGKRGQIGQLIELGIVALALMTIELNLSDIASAVGRSTPADIAEATRDMHVGIGDSADGSFLCDHVQRDGIHEVLAVGTLEKPQKNTSRTNLVVAGTPAYACNDMGSAQIQTHPSMGLVVGNDEGGKVSVESVCRSIL